MLEHEHRMSTTSSVLDDAALTGCTAFGLRVPAGWAVRGGCRSVAAVVVSWRLSVLGGDQCGVDDDVGLVAVDGGVEVAAAGDQP